LIGAYGMMAKKVPLGDEGSDSMIYRTGNTTYNAQG
jgi:hypothetical protein